MRTRACLRMRKLRQSFFGILDTPSTNDDSRPPIVRLPERDLVDPIGYLQCPHAKIKGFQHLDLAAGDAIGLAELQGRRLCPHNTSILGKAAGWAASVRLVGPASTISTSASGKGAPAVSAVADCWPLAHEDYPPETRSDEIT